MENTIKFKCIKEALREDGSKIMQFTKGEVYIGVSDGYGGYCIEDNNFNYEHFFNTSIMFKKLKSK